MKAYWHVPKSQQLECIWKQIKFHPYFISLYFKFKLSPPSSLKVFQLQFCVHFSSFQHVMCLTHLILLELILVWYILWTCYIQDFWTHVNNKVSTFARTHTHTKKDFINHPVFFLETQSFVNWFWILSLTYISITGIKCLQDSCWHCFVTSLNE